MAEADGLCHSTGAPSQPHCRPRRNGQQDWGRGACAREDRGDAGDSLMPLSPWPRDLVAGGGWEHPHLRAGRSRKERGDRNPRADGPVTPRVTHCLLTDQGENCGTTGPSHGALGRPQVTGIELLPQTTWTQSGDQPDTPRVCLPRCQRHTRPKGWMCGPGQTSSPETKQRG